MKTSLTGLVDRAKSTVNGRRARRREAGVTPDDVMEYLVDERTRPYQAGPVTPLAQLVTRGLLWGGVAVGFVGGVLGVVALARSSGDGDPVVVDDDVPAAVAGVAELTVEAWLTGEDKLGDEEVAGRWDDLFVEEVDLGLHLMEDVRILGLATVGGERVHDGYWAVTVAADVLPRSGESVEDLESVEDDGELWADDEPVPMLPQVETWYLEVGVVGDAAGGLAPVRAPALMPAPPGAGNGWRVAGPRPEVPEDDDVLAPVVEGFLEALLTEEGEPERFMVPGVSVSPIRPAPFSRVTLEAMSTEAVGGDDDEGDHVRVQAHVRVTSEAGGSRDAAYQVLAVRRANRWEVADLWGAPTLGGVPTGVTEDEE